MSEHLSPSCHQGVYPRNVALVCHLKVSVSFSLQKTVPQVLNILSQAALAAFYAGITVLFLSKAVAQAEVRDLRFNFILIKRHQMQVEQLQIKLAKSFTDFFCHISVVTGEKASVKGEWYCSICYGFLSRKRSLPS